MTTVKVGTAVETGDNLLRVAACSYLGTVSGLDLGQSLSQWSAGQNLQCEGCSEMHSRLLALEL